MCFNNQTYFKRLFILQAKVVESVVVKSIRFGRWYDGSLHSTKDTSEQDVNSIVANNIVQLFLARSLYKFQSEKL